MFDCRHGRIVRTSIMLSVLWLLQAAVCFAEEVAATTASAAPATTAAESKTPEAAAAPPSTSAEPQGSSDVASSAVSTAAPASTSEPASAPIPPVADASVNASSQVAPPAPTPISKESETAGSLNPQGQKRIGFALELHMGITKPIWAGEEEELMDFSVFEGGLFLGGKIDRVVVGLGFDMSRYSYRERDDNSGDNYYDYSPNDKGSVTSLMFIPGVRVAMVRSQDKKVEMIGQFDIGAGTYIFTDDYKSTSTDQKYFLLDWDVGLGARYFVHPQFAFSAVGGIRGEYYHYSGEDLETGYSSEYSAHMLSVFGTLQILGVF